MGQLVPGHSGKKSDLILKESSQQQVKGHLHKCNDPLDDGAVLLVTAVTAEGW